jgi:hypothetical protein
MKRVFFFALMLMAVGSFGSPPAHAQLDLSTVASAVDPITKLPGDKWVTLATSIMNGKAVVGRPEIFVINATGQELSAVICDGKWQLVGPKPYLKEAPNSLPAWKITLVPTLGFDGYCKSAIIGQSDNGTLYKATLVSVDGTFTNAAFITFRLPQ